MLDFVGKPVEMLVQAVECFALHRKLATAFLRVANLEAPPPSLLSPANVLRVVCGNLSRRWRERDRVGQAGDPSAVARAKAEA